jgi:hypothetical protein
MFDRQTSFPLFRQGKELLDVSIIQEKQAEQQAQLALFQLGA